MPVPQKQILEELPELELDDKLSTDLQIVKDRRSLAIETEDGEKTARKLMTDLVQLRRRVEQAQKEQTSKWEAYVKSVKDSAKVWTTVLDNAIHDLNNGIIAYLSRKRASIEALNRKALESTNKKNEKAADRAVAKGKPLPVPVPAATRPMPAKTVEVAPGVTQTERDYYGWELPGVGSVEECKKLRRGDPRLGKAIIPDCYWVLDTALISQQAKASKGQQILPEPFTVKKRTGIATTRDEEEG